MGQYYSAINVDKKEVIHPHDYRCGAKLMEFSYLGSDGTTNDFLATLSTLIMGDWNGDRVYIVGDYADFEKYNDIDDLWLPTLHELKNEFEFGFEDREGDEVTLHRFAENWKIPDVDITDFRTLKFLCNSETKEYIDLTELPVQWENENGTTTAIHPLPLLIAMGNERGGGDYHEEHIGFEFVGRWVKHTKGIFFADEAPDDYTEFKPNFREDY